MRTIEVRRTIQAAPERVFDLLADPATYPQFPGVRAATLLRAGTGERLGVGAVRQIDLGPARFVEEITAYERGRRLDYLVVRSRPRSEHLGGSIRFDARPDGGEVTWTSTFRIPIPLVGPLATAVAARRMARAFDDAIRFSDQLALGDRPFEGRSRQPELVVPSGR